MKMACREMRLSVFNNLNKTYTHTKKSELKHIKKVRKNGIDAQAEWHKMSGDCVIKNASIFSIDHLSLC